MEQMINDTDTELIWDYLKHVHPDLTLNHVIIYKSLWQVEPQTGEKIIQDNGLARATTYKILKELTTKQLIKKTSYKPIGYYANQPIKDYHNYSQKLIKKLLKGKEQLKKIMKNSTSLSGELYLIKKDGGQQKLILKQNRKTLQEQQLNEIKQGIEQQLAQIKQNKTKSWAIYK